LRELITNWQPESLQVISAFLAKYDTLPPSVESIHQYLERARQMVRALPDSKGRTGLMGLTEYLARQTDALAVCA
jgi:hypothetical protein